MINIWAADILHTVNLSFWKELLKEAFESQIFALAVGAEGRSTQ